MKKIESMTLIALGAALIAALSPFTIPLGPIPITLQTLAIGLIASIYRPKEATLSVLIYLLLGAIGLPVFEVVTEASAPSTVPLPDSFSSFLFVLWLPLASLAKRDSPFVSS